MAPGECEVCGRESDMPFTCKFCDGHHCARHRLPENHACSGLAVYKQRLREEGRLMHEPGETLRADVARTARWRARVDDWVNRGIARIEGRAAYTMLGLMLGVFVLEIVIGGIDPSLVDRLFVMGPAFYLEPWTLLTSVFAHAGLNHLFGNGLMMFFFGPALEKLIGSKRFTLLFLGGGIAAGLGQILVFSYLLPMVGFPAATGGVLGASGGIMAILATLTWLAPRLTVYLFFFLPMPLWLMTILYAGYDLLFAFDLTSNVAHIAHLVGLGIGLWTGWSLKQQGVGRRLQQRSGIRWKEYL